MKVLGNAVPIGCDAQLFGCRTQVGLTVMTGDCVANGTRDHVAVDPTLRQHIVGTSVHGFHREAGILEAGEHDHRGRRGLFGDRIEYGQTEGVRQRQIHQDAIVRSALECVDCIVERDLSFDIEPCLGRFPERAEHHSGIELVRFDEKNPEVCEIQHCDSNASARDGSPWHGGWFNCLRRRPDRV